MASARTVVDTSSSVIDSGVFDFAADSTSLWAWRVSEHSDRNA
ncbi:hypothetical protein [Streptomyces scopuliridis]|uniref:Uncharacterized protein n=1 Tax=Streptomyces scopuliridis RB72 TaxID=1440053 RepID=A0A2T7T9F2_9ACTN|nr:hypothetical protein [Streptomyces scopuliridis]PVE11767.1 hypothetical protein Y717_15710 [Streptomyces scopuliridis RB72]